jgi:hypothetical protein
MLEPAIFAPFPVLIFVTYSSLMQRVSSTASNGVITLLGLTLGVLALTGCSGIYFNTTFNAEKAHKQALDMRSKRLRLNPDDTVVVTSEERAKLTRAVTKSSKVLELWPNDPKYTPRAVFRIAECQLLMEEYGNAAYKYGEYIRYYPKEKNIPLARVRMAKALYLDGKGLAAREALNEVLAADPQGEIRREALLLSARMRIDDRSGAEGLELYEQLLKDEALLAVESRNELHWRAATLAYDLGQWQKARDHALAVDAPDLPARVRFRSHRLAVLSLYGMGRQAEGLAEVAELWDRREFRAYRPDIKLLEARGFESRGDWPGAFRLYRETVRLGKNKPSAAEAWYRVGARYLDVINREDTAKAYFDSAVAAGRAFEFGERAFEVSESLKRLAELRQMDSATLAFAAIDTALARRDSVRIADSLGLAAKDSSGSRLAGTDSTANGDADLVVESKESKGKKKKGKDKKVAIKKVEVARAPSAQYAPFLIAEIFQYRLPKPDSVRVFLNRIVADTLEDSIYTRRAFYALAWLETETYHNKSRSDSLYRALMTRYPGTEWAKQAEKNLGLPPTVQTPDDKAHALFLEAEKRRLANENLKTRVVPAYQVVGNDYPQSRDAAKALYAVAFSLEQAALVKSDTTQLDTVKAAYAVIRDRYPGTPQAVAAESWIASVEQARNSGDSRSDAPAHVPEPDGDGGEDGGEEGGPPKVELLDPAAEQDLY